jgi:hybrid cluster-associated redox disulfide protein
MINMLVALAALGALGIAIITYGRERSLRDSLREAQRRLYLAQARLNELENTVQRELQALRAVMRRQSGGPIFEPTMRIADAVALDPRVRDVLAQFHLGGCSSCAINEEHTIAQAAASYGVDLAHLMASLESLGSGQVLQPQGVRHGRLLQLEVL